MAQLSDDETRDEKLHFYYIGGSITQGYDGKDTLAPEATYIGWVEAWFEEHYPGRTAHHRAGRSGTTSYWGAACIDSIVEQVSSKDQCPVLWILWQSHKTLLSGRFRWTLISQLWPRECQAGG